jgi:hypothetical protein
VGAVSILNVVKVNNAGGTATINGVMIFHRNATFTPGPMAVDFVLAASGATLVQGSSFQTDPAQDTWIDPNGVLRGFRNVGVTAAGIGYTIS